METLTTKEVADALKISKPTLLRWIREGFIPDVGRDGRQWRRWSEEDLANARNFMETYHQVTSNEDVVRQQKAVEYEKLSKHSRYVAKE